MRLPAADPNPSARASRLAGVQVTWLGHATFLMRAASGARVLFDPFIARNPACPPHARRVGPLELILITHGHSDHCDDAAPLARESGATVVTSPEIARWLERQGVKHVRPMNIGGRQTVAGVDITMVPAVHSSSADDGTYLGPAAGFLVRFDQAPAIYFAGDTALFGDMRLIADRYAPDVAFLPIGDRFTMGPEEAAIAAQWLGVKTIVPMHYGTFPALTGTPDELRAHLAGRGIDVVELHPGETVG